MFKPPAPYDLEILRQSNLRFAVAGVTHWHAEYYRDILLSAGVELVGATDSDQPAGRAKASSWHLPFSDSLKSLIADHQPNFLFVLPRHDRASEEIAEAAATGLPFLVEKPMGLDATGAKQAAGAVQSANIFADVALPMRHTGIWAALDDIHSTWSSEVLAYAHFRTINGPAERYNGYGASWMLDQAKSGGGALRNLGFHGVDAAICLAGSIHNLTVEGATVVRRTEEAVEHYASAILRTAGGGVITLEAGYALPSPTSSDQEWRISTDKAFLCQRDGKLRTHFKEDKAAIEQALPGLPDPYGQMLVNSVGAFLSGKPPLSPLKDAVTAAALVDRIYALAD